MGMQQAVFGGRRGLRRGMALGALKKYIKLQIDGLVRKMDETCSSGKEFAKGGQRRIYGSKE